MLSKLIEEYIVWLKRERLAAETTVNSWRSALRLFSGWMRDELTVEPTLHHFTKDRLIDFRFYLVRDRGCRPRSVRRYFAALRSFNKWLIEVRHLTHENIAAQVNIGKMDAEVRPQVSDEEVMLLLEAADKIDDERERTLAKAVLSVFAYGGLRRAECLNLRLKDIASDGRIQVDKGKGGKNRPVYPSKECIEAIAAWQTIRPKAKHDWLWAINKGKG